MNELVRRLWHWLPATILVVAPPASGQPFVSPIGGTPYVDWTIVNYVDLDPIGGVLDYRGGNYTYNGHNAIDFTLANFVAMDAGVPVYAAAAGTVIYTHDGEFDRCSRTTVCGNFPNYVGIQHADGILSEYFHLKKDSVSVSVGQPVTAGQQIAEVGSSGLSSDAHLHFAVYNSGPAVETYLDPGRWWIDPVPYAGDVFGSLDHGISNHFPTTAELENRPADHYVFEQAGGAGQLAASWAHLHGMMPAMILTTTSTDPMALSMLTSTTTLRRSAMDGGSSELIYPTYQTWAPGPSTSG